MPKDADEVLKNMVRTETVDNVVEAAKEAAAKLDKDLRELNEDKNVELNRKMIFQQYLISMEEINKNLKRIAYVESSKIEACSKQEREYQELLTKLTTEHEKALKAQVDQTAEMTQVKPTPTKKALPSNEHVRHLFGYVVMKTVGL
jgi:hypothetical protein